ncbi:unnamed protein product [Allacma fusca]|uniref:Uncharacterized protein n=1 Tax=Allacma fusca TaxID=39272 RepID=A0A8J2PKA5_9HEXA|nr:unnamed protein product [Allacma fusca]
MLSPVVHKYQRKTVEVDRDGLKAALRFVKAGNTYRAAEETYGAPEFTIHRYRNFDIDQIPSHVSQDRFKRNVQEKVNCEYTIAISRRFYALTNYICILSQPEVNWNLPVSTLLVIIIYLICQTSLDVLVIQAT